MTRREIVSEKCSVSLRFGSVDYYLITFTDSEKGLPLHRWSVQKDPLMLVVSEKVSHYTGAEEPPYTSGEELSCTNGQ